MVKRFSIKIAIMVGIWSALAFGSHSAFADKTSGNPIGVGCVGLSNNVSEYICGSATSGSFTAIVDVIKDKQGNLSPNTLDLKWSNSANTKFSCQMTASKIDVYNDPGNEGEANGSFEGPCTITPSKGPSQVVKAVAAFGVEQFNVGGKEYMVTNVQYAASPNNEIGGVTGWVTAGVIYAGNPALVLPKE